MGHIQDRWWREERDPVTQQVTRVKTSSYGKGLRYKVRYLDPQGNEKWVPACAKARSSG